MSTPVLTPADVPRRKGLLHAVSFEQTGSTWRVHTQCAGASCGGTRLAYELKDWARKDGFAKCRKCAIKRANAFEIGPKSELRPLPQRWAR